MADVVGPILLFAFLIGVQQLALGFTDIPGAIISRWIGAVLLGGAVLVCGIAEVVLW